MPTVFIIASIQKESDPGEEHLAGAVLSALAAEAHISPRRIREVHWGGDADAPAALQQAGFSQETALLPWPAAPLLEHYALHAASRAIEGSERDLILLGQCAPEIACAALLASPSAVGRYNLLPRARLAMRLTRSGSPAAVLDALAAQIDKSAAQAAEAAKVRRQSVQNSGGLPVLVPSQQMLIEDSDEPAELPFPAEIAWVASGEAITADALRQVFPQARRLVALPPAPPGEWFLLHGLLNALHNSRERWGLLLTVDPQGTALATLIERV